MTKNSAYFSTKYELLNQPIRTNGHRRSWLWILCILALCSMFYFVSQNSKIIRVHFYKSFPTSTITLIPEFHDLLTNSANLILLEPHLLSKMTGFSVEQFNDFRWRFDLPPGYSCRQNSLTVGIFAENFFEQLNIGSFSEKTRVSGPFGPFNVTGSFAQHVFYERNTSSIGIPLHVHLVVLFPVKHFLWIGSIPESILFDLNDLNEQNPNRSFTINYGRHEEIYDPFEVIKQFDGFPLPDDIPHLLSQLPTSKYIHCNPEKTTKWFSENNQTINKNKVESSEMGFIGMKSFMRTMQMQFWMACGTLLGWYRQCQITPYTTDTDFATWSKYVRGAQDLTPILKKESRNHKLYMYNRFGERMHSLEYSFATTSKWEKLDLFFIYQNQTHFLLPFHVMPKFGFSIYPKYNLCSGELLGFKLLVPCDPEKIIVTEYGVNWQKPVSSWNYYTAPRNVGPLLPFTYNVTQHESFD